MIDFSKYKILDISPIVSERMAVFPGDVPFSRSVSLDMKNGDNLTLSSLTTSLHIGAHTDAPIHYNASGVSADSLPLETYMGLAQVISVPRRSNARIRVSDLAGKKITASRVLFRTDSFPDPNHWNSDFMSLSAELIDHLAQNKVILVGIDTPSIDPENDKNLESHNAVFRHKMAILEGVVLKSIAEGEYVLLALPLNISGADATPVRAVLLEKEK